MTPDAVAALRAEFGARARAMFMQGSLEEDYAALRKLRDDSLPRGVFKEWLSFDSEDPGTWNYDSPWGRVKCVTVKGGRVTKLDLSKCSSLAELPDAIGKLGALTELNLRECSSLAALPAAIGELKALTTLCLPLCESLVALCRPRSAGSVR